MAMLKHYLKDDIFKVISEIVTEQNSEAYVIGGFVRDIFLERPSKDIDVVVVGSGIELAKAVAKRLPGYTKVSVFKNFGTAMIKSGDVEVEFVGARKESYNRNSRKPIVENGTLQDDQNRRDFTINAFAIGLHKDKFGQLLDPFNGMDDLMSKTIRTPLDPEITFSDDPLRMMRAIRFATQLDFSIEEKTFEAITATAKRIKIISAERVIDELNKIMKSPKPSKGFKLLDKCGLLRIIFPELFQMKGVETKNKLSHKDNFYHTLEVLDNIAKVSDNLWLLWSALLHDIGKPRTKKFTEHGWTFHGHEFVGSKMIPNIFRRMKLPMNEKMKYVQKLVLLHLRPIALVSDIVTDSAVRRLLFDAGDDIDDLMKLCKADVTSKNHERVAKFQKNFDLVQQKLLEIEEKDRVRNFQPPVSGEDIMTAFGIKPSQEIGTIKMAIKDAILDGEIPNDRESAYQYMIKKGKELGLTLVK